MIEHLHTMIIVITYNFLSLKTSFLGLLKIFFVYSTWTSFREPRFDFEFGSIERFRFLYFIGY